MTAMFEFADSTPSPYCGRIDQHAPHGWLGMDWDGDEHHTLGAVPRIARKCPGWPLIEGGSPVARTWK
jgi:hypothetical protein